MVARQDLATDPLLKSALLLARRGTAHFGTKLNELRDEDLDGPSQLPEWTRRHIIAHVAYQARALAALAEQARGQEDPAPSLSLQEQAELVAFGATLPPMALRNLFSHSAVHLDVEWRDTTPAAWQDLVTVNGEYEVPLADTVMLRAHEIWTHTIDLNNGARWEEVPPEILDYRPGPDSATGGCLFEAKGSRAKGTKVGTEINR